MSVDLSTTGGRLKDLGLPGADADEGPQINDTLYNEATTGGIDSAGAIDFGVGVAKATTDGHCKPISGNSDVCIGISTRAPQVMSASNLTTPVVGWPGAHGISVKRIGCMYAVPYEDVRANDQVIAIVAQGGKLGGTKGGIVGTGRLKVQGARWKTTTTANTVGIIEVIGRVDPVLTS